MLAGFVLGFTVSTLWEWLYYRGRRLRWRADATGPVGSTTINHAVGGSWREPEIDRADAQRAANQTLPWETPAYRSPGVFLESEKEFTAQPLPPADQFTTTSFVTEPSAPPTVADVLASTAPIGQNVVARKPTAVPIEQARVPTPPDAFVTATPTVTPPTPTPPSVEPPTEAAAPTSIVTDPPATADCAAPSTTGQTRQATPLVDAPVPAPEAAPVAPVPATNPAPARSNGYPDDLTRIQGIGEAYKHRLYAACIYTWQQVANSEVETLRSITKAKPNARPDEWKTQAQELATKFNRLEAVYEGPVPDDLSRIDGIGPIYADTLYRAGICTYEQLAAAPIAALAVILPTPAIGNEFNFTSWIKQATKLAYAKQKNINLLR